MLLNSAFARCTICWPNQCKPQASRIHMRIILLFGVAYSLLRVLKQEGVEDANACHPSLAIQSEKVQASRGARLHHSLCWVGTQAYTRGAALFTSSCETLCCVITSHAHRHQFILLLQRRESLINHIRFFASFGPYS